MCASATPYDDVFRTILNDCKELIYPLLNEIFQEGYTGSEDISFGMNEHFMNQQQGKSKKRITDSSFTVKSVLIIRYHLECQSTSDFTMDKRMFEYDSQIALEDSEKVNDILNLPFPKSAVLFLRKPTHTIKKMKLCIKQYTKEFILEIRTLYVTNYTIEELIQKNLFILFPFHIFCYEKELKEMNNNSVKLQKLQKSFLMMKRYLEQMNKYEKLSEYNFRTIIRMTINVIASLCKNYDNVKKEVLQIMGGEILEYPEKTILNEGKQIGLSEGRKTAYIEMVQKGFLNLQEAADEIPMDVEELKKIIRRTE